MLRRCVGWLAAAPDDELAAESLGVTAVRCAEWSEAQLAGVDDRGTRQTGLLHVPIPQPAFDRQVVSKPLPEAFGEAVAGG